MWKVCGGILLAFFIITCVLPVACTGCGVVGLGMMAAHPTGIRSVFQRKGAFL